jgi:calcineurin-like phosphoesterase family protein
MRAGRRRRFPVHKLIFPHFFSGTQFESAYRTRFIGSGKISFDDGRGGLDQPDKRRHLVTIKGISVTEFFIADMHFGGASNATRRGFVTSAAMDEAIISAWRKRVTADDDVWVVGDVGDLCPVASLPGRKHLIYGNTDRPKAAFTASGCFLSHADSHILNTPQGPILLVHRPCDASIDDMPVIHGHTHAKQAEPDPRFVSVSVDKTDWGPITLDEVLARFAERQDQAANAL